MIRKKTMLGLHEGVPQTQLFQKTAWFYSMCVFILSFFFSQNITHDDCRAFRAVIVFKWLEKYGLKNMERTAYSEIGIWSWLVNDVVFL
jgi:hypothetical protein